MLELFNHYQIKVYWDNNSQTFVLEQNSNQIKISLTQMNNLILNLVYEFNNIIKDGNIDINLN